MIVLDASVTVELLLNTRLGRQAAERIADPRRPLHAPQLLDLEVAQALRRYSSAGMLEPERAARAIEHLEQLEITRWEHPPLLRRVWMLRHNLTAYDAAYVALAEALDAVLLTADRRLAGAPALPAAVQLLS